VGILQSVFHDVVQNIYKAILVWFEQMNLTKIECKVCNRQLGWMYSFYNDEDEPKYCSKDCASIDNYEVS
jgi:hypothetical protein